MIPCPVTGANPAALPRVLPHPLGLPGDGINLWPNKAAAVPGRHCSLDLLVPHVPVAAIAGDLIRV